MASLFFGAWQTSLAQCAPAAAVPSVNICAPAAGATVGSPFQVIAATNDNITVHVTQIYVDGTKRYEVLSGSLNSAVSLAEGPHELIVQGIDVANRVFKQAIYITVGNTTASTSPTTAKKVSGSGNYQSNLTADSNWIAANSLAPSGAILYGSSKINPYYSNIAAIGMTKDPARYNDIKNWMQWYVGHLNWPDKWGVYGSTYDYDVNGSVETSTGDADSTDSYAATFVSLAWAYYRTGDPGAQAYVRTLAYQIETVAGVVMSTQDSDGLTWAKPDYHIKYLMDNCEAYRGLRDAASLFQYAFGDSAKAAYFNSAADSMLNGLNGMWLGNGAFGVYKDALARNAAPNWRVWYADATSQVFPVLMGVISPSDPRAQQVYANFNANWPGWANLSFQAQDPFPWVLVGGAAALMGDTARVNTYMNAIQNKYVSQGFPWTWYSAEAGWYMRLNSYMMGRGY
ncbi:MAG: hypothetical protein JOY79_00535 [Acidobacteriaceae bacterium]|nr:hypothetical protein [Acidobacteriaceae bacterium]